MRVGQLLDVIYLIIFRLHRYIFYVHILYKLKLYVFTEKNADYKMWPQKIYADNNFRFWSEKKSICLLVFYLFIYMYLLFVFLPSTWSPIQHFNWVQVNCLDCRNIILLFLLLRLLRLHTFLPWQKFPSSMCR